MPDRTDQASISELLELLDSIEERDDEPWDLSELLSSSDEELLGRLEEMQAQGVASGDSDLELLLDLIESDDDRSLDSVLILRTEGSAKSPAGLAGRALILLGTIPGLDQGELVDILFGEDYRLPLHATSPDDVSWTPLAAVAFIARFEPLTLALSELENHLEAAYDILSSSKWFNILQALRQGRRLHHLLEGARTSLQDQGYRLSSENKLIVSTGGRRGQPPLFLRQLTAQLYDYFTDRLDLPGNTVPIQRTVRALLSPYVDFGIDAIRSAISDHLRSG